MAKDNGLGIKSEILLQDLVINEQLIDDKKENDCGKKLKEELQLQSYHELIQTWVKLLKDIWIGEEKKIVKVGYFFVLEQTDEKYFQMNFIEVTETL